MRWKIVSRVAKRTHEQFRVEVYLRVGVQTRRARFTPHRFVRDNLRRANERERERNKKRERKSTSEYPHRSLVRERERNRRRRRRVRIRLARTTTKQSISKINPFLSQRRIQKPKIDVAPIDARHPANLLAKRRHHHRKIKKRNSNCSCYY